MAGTNEVKRRHDHKKVEIMRERKSVPCTDCGIQYPPYVMDFDHVRGIKEFHIAMSVQHVSIKRLNAEMDKCDVVCSNCHRIRTYNRREESRGISANGNTLDLHSRIAGSTPVCSTIT